jgi:flagellar hook-associated protein 1
MGMTLGLNSALSGLLTAQKGLDVISQNVVNVNTPGYTRKIMNQESVVLAGTGAGVQEASVTRAVDDGLMKSMRAQDSTMGKLNTEQLYYPQMEDMFGQVGDSNSIAHTVSNLSTALDSLSTNVNQTSTQFGAVQSGVDTTSQLNNMTTQIQNMRLDADSRIATDVTQINSDLSSIYDLNKKIVRNTAIGAEVSDLQDQRDNKINDVAKYMDITYFPRNDGAMTIYTGGGQVLLDSQPVQLTHAASTITDSWMSQAGGQFNKITIGVDPNSDLGSQIGSGELRGLLDMRDTTLPNLQSQLDEMAHQLKTTVNEIHNRGTSLPNLTNSYSGTTTFATQGNIAQSTGDTTATITYGQGAQTATNTTGGTGGAGFGSLDYSYSAVNGQITITGATVSSLSAVQTPGSVFTISHSPTAANDGTYTVTAYNATTNALTVRRGNPVQSFSLANGADSAVTLFDTGGNQITTTTVNAIMTTDYSASYPGDAQGTAQASGGPWSLDTFSKHMQGWLRAQNSLVPGISSATVGLDTNGHMQMNLGGTVKANLAFRDQVSSAQGATAQDATINFDVDGNVTADKSVQGLSNFFGLNDFFVNTQPAAIQDSAVQNSNFTTQATRTLRLFDPAGQIGNQISVPANSTLQNIADMINSNTQVSQSAPQTNTTFTTTTASSFSVEDSSGTLVTAGFGAGAVTLQQIADSLTTGSVTAQVTQDGTSPVQSRLRVTDSRGVPLTIVVTGGALSSTTSLNTQINMQPTQPVRASVVPDGSGQRLRVVQSDNRDLYVAADPDIYGKSLISDLGLRDASTREAGVITVRKDIQSGPSKISRGAVQWNENQSQYYMSEGDNSTALQMASAMTTKVAMDTAGAMTAGNYTFTEHAGQSVAITSQQANSSKDQQTYQQTLKDSLNSQYTSTSGVNLDEEVSHMIDFQRAYSASAKVISALNDMLTQLTDIIH